MEPSDLIRRPSGAPAIYQQKFPVIPPSSFALTDDLFTALNLKPLFDEYIGEPEEHQPEKQQDIKEDRKRESADGDASAGPSTPTSAPVKREWKKPPKNYDHLLGGLPDPYPLGTQQVTQLLPFLGVVVLEDKLPTVIPDPPGFVRQDLGSKDFRFAPILNPKSITDVGVVTLREGKARGVKDVYTNGQKNPRRIKGGPPPGPDQLSKSRKKRDAQKARSEYHARNRATAPGQLEHSTTSNYDLTVGSPRSPRTPGTPGTPVPRPRTPGYASPGYRPGPGSRVGTPGYVNSPRP